MVQQRQHNSTFVHSGETFASTIQPLFQQRDGHSPVIVSIDRRPTAAASIASFMNTMNDFMSMPVLRDLHVAVMMERVGVVVREPDGTRVQQGPWDMWWFSGNSDVIFACAVTEPLQDALVGRVRIQCRPTN